ncbi:MAG: T9SS type A sorting domain-containing protein, partial [Bacteroidota bacterium]|nr:T9SS type A sorting domain-containing protein [Bacteroidota bacterium]
YAPEMHDHLERWSYGSYATWENNIQNALINFARDRRQYVNQHYISKFGLSGTSALTVQVNSSEMGQVYINDMPVPYLNNTGEYFNDVPIRLAAIPKPGFQFSHWELPDASTFDTLTFSLVSDTLIRAVFEAGQQSEKNIRINEVMSKNATSVCDNWNEHEDWIELYNHNDVPYNLGGLYLTDDWELPFKWLIPDRYADSVTLEPYGFGLFYADNEFFQGVRHCNFKLNSDGETIFLLKNVTGIPVILDSVTYNPLSEDTSWGRIPDGVPVWKEFDTPTPGKSNVALSSDQIEAHQTKLHLFPNPATSYVNVQLKSDAYQSHRLTIYSLSGAILKTVEFYGSKKTIDISNLTPGIYIVGIEDEPMLRMKLIIQ